MAGGLVRTASGLRGRFVLLVVALAGALMSAPAPSGGVARAAAPAFGLHVGDAAHFRWHALVAAWLGASVVPLEFRWDEVEPTTGRFVWEPYDQAVAAARGAGLRVVGVLHYPAHLPPPSRSARIGWPSAHVDDWDFFVRRVVTRYQADIRDWIVVRGRIGARDPLLAAAEAELDAQLVQLTASAVRAVGSGVRVLAAAPGADLRWLSVFAARGGLAAVDGLALDVNRWPAAPEGLTVVVDDVRFVAAQTGAAPELWVWRFGYPTHVGFSSTPPHRPGVSADEQAAYVVRAHVLLASAGVSTVLWRELVDAGVAADDAAGKFGLYERIGGAKPAARAYRTMASRLAGLAYVGPEEAARVLQQAAPAEEVLGSGSAAKWEDARKLAEEPAAVDKLPVGQQLAFVGELVAVKEPAREPAEGDAAQLAEMSEPSRVRERPTFEADAVLAEAAAAGAFVHAHLFSGDERAVVVMWTSPFPGEGETLVRLLDGLPVRAFDLFGRPLEKIALSIAPVYVELSPAGPLAER